MKELAEKVLSIVDCGLVRGLGQPEPGQMCVEAAVCKALDEPHSDRPSCVHEAVAEFKARLNDCSWKDDMSRAAGLREIAVCQLGSKDINVEQFARVVTNKIIAEVLLPLIADRSDDADFKTLCRQLQTHTLTSDDYATALDSLRERMPLDKTIRVAIFGRGGFGFTQMLSVYDVIADCQRYLNDAEWSSAPHGAVAAVDLFMQLDTGATSCCADGSLDEAPLVEIARIGCDALREQNVPGVAAWDELQAQG